MVTSEINKQNKSLKVSVFIPNHNNEKFIGRAIESVLNQTYKNFELLIYDDGSTDNSLEIINQYEDERIKVFGLKKQDNVGVVINKSFREATGDYWCWCPSDDFFAVNLLETKVRYSPLCPDTILYNNYFIIDENDNMIGQKLIKEMSPQQFSEEVWRTSPIGFTGIFIPNKIFKSLPFPEHLKYSEDFYWMIKATIHGVSFYGIPEVLHYKRKHSGSLTSKNIKDILNNIPIIRSELLKYKNNYESI